MDFEEPFFVLLCRRPDGAVGARVEPGLYYDEGTPYLWEEGNYSCDCFRELLFFENDHTLEEEVCGDTYRLWALLPDGTWVDCDWLRQEAPGGTR